MKKIEYEWEPWTPIPVTPRRVRPRTASPKKPRGRPRIVWTRERLESCIERVPESGCWLWMRRISTSGYGRVSVDGVKTEAHRLSYRLFNGDFPPEMFVLHRCDTPSCVNPAHLFLGTQADNMKDAAAKGRFSNRAQNRRGRRLA